MKLEMMFIGALAFGLVFIVFLGIYAESLDEYGVEVDTSTTFGKMSSNIQQLQTIQGNMKDEREGGAVTDENAVDDMIAGGYKAIRTNPFKAVTIAANASMTLAQETNFLTPEIISFLMYTIGILTLFALIAIIFKFTQR